MFTLALALGRTVSELEASMSSSEFSEWIEYYQLEPFGQWRDNWHAAQIAALLFNANRGKTQQPLKAQDFMFATEEEQAQRKQDEFFASLASLAKPKAK